MSPPLIHLPTIEIRKQKNYKSDPHTLGKLTKVDDGKDKNI